jgi:hypothetical protein
MTESGDEQLRTIDEILAVLQSPARAEELDGEKAVQRACEETARFLTARKLGNAGVMQRAYHLVACRQA